MDRKSLGNCNDEGSLYEATSEPHVFFFVREKPYMQTLSPVFSASAILVQYKAKSTSVLFAPALVLNKIFHLVVEIPTSVLVYLDCSCLVYILFCAIFCIFLRSSVSIILVCFVFVQYKFILF